MKLTKKEQNKLNKQLIEAIKEDNLSAVESAVVAGADVNARNKKYKGTSLHASIWRDTEIMKLLLKHGADPNIQNNSEETSLLLTAARNYIDKTKLLLDYNADMYIKNNKNRTPFTEAFRLFYYDITKLFVLYGYIPTEEDFDSIRDTDKRTEVKAQFMKLAQQVQSHNAKLMEAANIDQEIQCCDEYFDF